jgi:hypothetical protein
MSNVHKVSLQEAIRCLHQKGWGQRRIAREMGVHRKTIKGYVEGNAPWQNRRQAILKTVPSLQAERAGDRQFFYSFLPAPWA